MKCEICGEKTGINWGEGNTVLCKKHSDRASELEPFKKASQKENEAEHKKQVELEKKKTNSPSMLRWKLYGSIIMFCLVVVAIATGTLYLPSKSGFLYRGEDPEMFWSITAFCFLLACYSSYEGYTGLKKHKNT
ncbi:hypothetical protein [Amphritea japonica]|uniref:hypothetical protein n=1 Tax=Amphritea japonica TaxID=452627 RepID=UPI0003684BCB|nr:hypothetical protein [Amphritea japonica]